MFGIVHLLAVPLWNLDELFHGAVWLGTGGTDSKISQLKWLYRSFVGRFCSMQAKRLLFHAVLIHNCGHITKKETSDFLGTLSLKNTHPPQGENLHLQPVSRRFKRPCVSPHKFSSPPIVVEATNLRRRSEVAAWWIQLQRYLEPSGAVGCILGWNIGRFKL